MGTIKHFESAVLRTVRIQEPVRWSGLPRPMESEAEGNPNRKTNHGNKQTP